MTSGNVTGRSVRLRLLRWGALIAAVYLSFVLFFPLVPTLYDSDRVLDIEMQLRDGERSIALIYVLGLLLLFIAYWRILKIIHTYSKENPASAGSLRTWVLGLGFLCGVLLIGLYPITALDVVLYVVRSRLSALYDASPMLLLPADFPQDPYIGYAGEYGRTPSPYGPLWELVARIPVQMGITDIAAGIVAMKVISLLSYVGMAVLLGWSARQEPSRYGVSPVTALTFFALNPLVLLEAMGNGHNDLLMLALMTLGLVFWQRDRWVLVTLALTLAALIKVTGLIILPLFGMAVLRAAPDWRIRLGRLLGMALVFGLLVLAAYSLAGPFPEVLEGNRHVMFGRIGYTPSYALRVLLRYLLPGRVPLIQLPTSLGTGLFILFYVYLLIKLLRRQITLIEAGFLAYFSQLFLGSTFRIWYPMWLIPFAALNLNSGTYWRTFLFGLTAELSILSYYILWRWYLSDWGWALTGPLKPYWDYWLVTTWITVPWTFGIPALVPLLIRHRNPEVYKNQLLI